MHMYAPLQLEQAARGHRPPGDRGRSRSITRQRTTRGETMRQSHTCHAAPCLLRVVWGGECFLPEPLAAIQQLV